MSELPFSALENDMVHWFFLKLILSRDFDVVTIQLNADLFFFQNWQWKHTGESAMVYYMYNAEF